MELTRLEKTLVLSALINLMKENEIDINLKASEAMKIGAILAEEVEHLPEKEQEETALQAYQNAVRKVYDSLAGEQE